MVGTETGRHDDCSRQRGGRDDLSGDGREGLLVAAVFAEGAVPERAGAEYGVACARRRQGSGQRRERGLCRRSGRSGVRGEPQRAGQNHRPVAGDDRLGLAPGRRSHRHHHGEAWHTGSGVGIRPDGQNRGGPVRRDDTGVRGHRRADRSHQGHARRPRVAGQARDRPAAVQRASTVRDDGRRRHENGPRGAGHDGQAGQRPENRDARSKRPSRISKT